MSERSSEKAQMKRGRTERETCELNGWAIGTRLVADEGYGPTVIRLTYFTSEGCLLAVTESRKGKPVTESERFWTLNCDDWAEAPPESWGVLRTPAEWCAEVGIRVLDPDGWRGRGGRPWSDPITREEFDRRLATCTVAAAGRSAVGEVRECPACDGVGFGVLCNKHRDIVVPCPTCNDWGDLLTDLIDQATSAHAGHSIGFLASASVAREVTEFMAARFRGPSRTEGE